MYCSLNENERQNEKWHQTIEAVYSSFEMEWNLNEMETRDRAEWMEIIRNLSAAGQIFQNIISQIVREAP